MKHTRVAAAALAALIAVACASQAPMPDLPGAPPRKASTEIRKDPNADQALAQVEAKARGQPKAKQVETYLNFRKAYPATTAGEEALYRAGVLSFELGDYTNARKQFNELLFENPLFPNAQDARLKLGLSALELKSYRDAYQTLLPLRDRVPAGQKAQLEEALRRAAEGARLYDQAMKMALQKAEQASTPEERSAALAQIGDLVDAQVGVEEVARVQADLSPSHPAWPLLTFKLARVYQHTRDIPKLKSTLQALLSDAPGSPYTAEAQEMLARADRVGQVRGRTVGVLLPLTGKYKAFGEAVMRGIRLALKGSEVELVVKDTQGDGTRAASAVEELVFNDGAVAAIGPLFIEDSKRAALVAQDLGLPILTLTRSEDVTDIGPFVFRNMLTYSAQTKGLVDWATKVMGYKSFAVLYPNTPYGVEMTNDFWDQVLAQGGAVRGAESYTSDQTTFTSQAKKLVGR
ncbi:MAG TPA: penicillin-binding protein activator, partial [Myxococcaceae bacterium]|nr:penicillin-binding protein activator [Myxococcaceae bacterium]